MLGGAESDSGDFFFGGDEFGEETMAALAEAVVYAPGGAGRTVENVELGVEAMSDGVMGPADWILSVNTHCVSPFCQLH